MSAVLLALFFAAAVPTDWDCFLGAEAVDCAQLEAAFYSATPLVVRAEDGVDVVVRSAPFEGGVEYVFSARGDGVRVELVDRIPASFADNATESVESGGGGGLGGGGDTGGGGGRGTGGGTGRGRLKRSAAVLVRLVGDLQRLVTPFLSVERPAKFAGNTMTLVLTDPEGAAGQARVDDVASDWYLSPTITGDAAQTALLRTQGRAQLDANWSHPAFRLFGSSWAGFVFLSAPAPIESDPPQTFGYAQTGVDVAFAYGLGGGTSVGVTTRVSHAPEQNQLLRLNSYVGLEWVLVPFLRTEGGNLGVRYLVGAEHQEFVHENVERSFEGNFLRQRAVAFATWHFPRVDVTGSIAAASVLKDATYSDVSASASVAWRVVNDLSVSLSTTASYRNALINAPDNLNELDPLERFVGGGNFGAINYTASVALVYVLGNSLLLRQDQRFSNGVEP